jgi:hypothetical protein
MVMFPLRMPAILRQVLRERAATMNVDMRQVLIESWLKHDKVAFERYLELKKEQKLKNKKGGE